jgi:hypothetical protein
MRCGRPSSRMTRCCAPRSRRTTGSCSATRGTVWRRRSPISAVSAAIDAQRELQLPVRMGIATGEAELREGDYFGAVLTRAARVMAAGYGGQVLVADSTAVLVSGVDLLDLGPWRLRDLPNPITVFQLQAPGLRTNFPPLRTLDPTPGNLRPAITSLIGRDTEVSDIQSGRALTSAGHIDRGRWRWQDPACRGSRDTPGRRIPGRGVGPMVRPTAHPPRATPSSSPI